MVSGHVATRVPEKCVWRARDSISFVDHQKFKVQTNRSEALGGTDGLLADVNMGHVTLGWRQKPCACVGEVVGGRLHTFRGDVTAFIDWRQGKAYATGEGGDMYTPFRLCTEQHAKKHIGLI